MQRSKSIRAGKTAKAPCGFSLVAMPRRRFQRIKWLPANQLGPGPWPVALTPGVAARRNSTPVTMPPSRPTTIWGPSAARTPSPATVVEVHQAAAGVSALYYHVGVLTLGASPSISWGPSLPFDSSGMTQGYAPTVSIANNGRSWFPREAGEHCGMQSGLWTQPRPPSPGPHPFPTAAATIRLSRCMETEPTRGSPDESWWRRTRWTIARGRWYTVSVF